MVVDVGQTGRGAERGRDDEAVDPPGGGAPAAGTRRRMMLGLLAPALAVTLAPLAAASSPSRTGGAPPHGSHPEPYPEPRPGPGIAAEPAERAAFDETYRGRRIRGVQSAAGRGVGAGAWHVTVDGRPLHLMRRADGSWVSMIDHYGSYPTPLAAARAAVDELAPGEQLSDTPAAGHDAHSGGRHGVHA